MAKIAFAVFDDVAPQTGFAADDETVSPGVATRVIFDETKGPLFLRKHDLPPGGSVRWQNSKAGHIVYVWTGAMEYQGQTLPAGSMILVEHKADAVVQAQGEGCTIIVMNAADPAKVTRTGGHVHIL